ncbi:MAG: GNAT family N-acetyltransferase [Gammaproteobacteria bacterium]|nr:GNAT family N-acetyltransferase [Gammaproteobacteria bacterium]
MEIEYKVNAVISVGQFIDLLSVSGLGMRRPIDDLKCMKGMLDNSNLIVTAWCGGALIGIARSVTDFNFACYLSDLAVDKYYQKCGVGKKLLTITKEQLGNKCKLILLAAPAAKSYYEYIGFKNNECCWVLSGDQFIGK